MISFLTGKVVDYNENSITLDCQNIGYLINVSSISLKEIIKQTDTVKIYTHLAVREDDMSLYGFSHKSERDMFLKLISISGIGPKAAMSILSSLTIELLSLSIVTGDVAQLSKVKGIGKKTAERLVLELKDKLKAQYNYDTQSITSDVIAEKCDDDAILALMALGYTNKQAVEIVKKVYKDGMNTEQIIFAALKQG